MKKLIQVSAPRCGSNLFCQLIKFHKRISVKFEVFHDKPFEVETIAREVCEREEVYPEALRAFAREIIDSGDQYNKEEMFSLNGEKGYCCARFLDEYMKPLKSEAFYFKLFPTHLPFKTCEKMIHWSDGVVFVERSVIAVSYTHLTLPTICSV